ncbi:hypothetical protein GCM10011392_13820 [Wenxinia marina]|uniref:Uncharacterized protein n=1 Tax=Wenxinia marina DSM 24838 TaxID=1123501 RepID=A0A0D0PEA0_9RHOB|nr:hypothetical protein Wenmar_02075 [Wenxinia marina DSM 24838]GGL60606.1 hypothetical protein GCM10011392_13820 [Wenxinia marina]
MASSSGSSVKSGGTCASPGTRRAARASTRSNRATCAPTIQRSGCGRSGNTETGGMPEAYSVRTP